MKDKMILKIVHVTDHFCIRVFKIAYPFICDGHSVHVLTAKDGTGMDFFDSVWRYEYGSGVGDRKPLRRDQFLKNIRMISDKIKPDIWHIHNEPDWICDEVIRLKNRTGKVVWDIHDPDSARNGYVSFEELDVIRDVDGIVYVSPEEKEWIEKVHTGARDKPSAVIYSVYPQSLLIAPKYKNRIPNSVVYEGGISRPGINEESMRTGNVEMVGGRLTKKCDMRDLSNLIQAFQMEGFNIHIYGANTAIGAPSPIADEYRKHGAIAEISQNPYELVAELTRWEWGLVGFPAMMDLFNIAMPNKLFDYLLAGVVPIVVNASAAGKFVRDNHIGIWYENQNDFFRAGELRKLQDMDTAEFRKNMLAAITPLLMENQKPRLLKLYEEVIKNGRPRHHGYRSNKRNADTRPGDGGSVGSAAISSVPSPCGRRPADTARVMGLGVLPGTPTGAANTPLGGKRHNAVPKT